MISTSIDYLSLNKDRVNSNALLGFFFSLSVFLRSVIVFQRIIFLDFIFFPCIFNLELFGSV